MTGEGLTDGAAPENGLRRLAWGAAISIPLNLAAWGFAARVAPHTRARPPDIVEITRVVLPSAPHPAVPKRPPKAAVTPRPTRAVSLHPRPLPTPQPILRSPSLRLPPPQTRPRQTRLRPVSAPQFTHNRVLISQGPTPAPNAALRGGGATPGVPASTQGGGGGAREVFPAPPPPPPTPEPDPPHHDVSAPPPTPPPMPVVTPKPIPSVTPQAGAPTPAGPTNEAQVGRLVLPEIPDYLQQEDYKSSVRVTVEIDAQGAATSVTLNSSSGNADIDKRVAAALKRSLYKPALQNGRPVAGTKRFRFDFEVR